ncbi:MAG: porphobilinogen synthase [Nitrospirota bacterium]|jgi:porphobilinogen synthase|nr:porphobilinogen synthase [Nitrospirota bacterium]MDX2419503.1 porphobilinogen synthase [Nitrospirota bacterium]
MAFPVHRLRRLRQHASLRRMVRETQLTPADLIYPLFVTFGENKQEPIESMPGQYRWSVDRLVPEVSQAWALGIPAVILFGIPEQKDETGSAAFEKDGVVQCAVRALKAKLPDLMVITDVCIDEYTSHGHCGIVRDGRIVNDETLNCLQTMALSHAEAGVDMVAPSDMMDGRVKAIREALDQQGYTDMPIMSYSAKYASALYAPFRDAAFSSPSFGDRRSYQMDPANAREALREVELDLEEGADIVMVKPALPYLDILRQVRDMARVPVAAYQVSGEYSMIKAAAQQEWIDETSVMMETLVSIKRAGADLILTYFAKDAAKLLNENDL